MSIGHPHPPGVFDAGQCRTCARRAGLLDHHDASRARKPASGGPWHMRGRPAGTRCGRWDPPGSGSCWLPSPC
jgi:hypothetical protein